ncbi:MAG: TIGR04283 family arsenosugar biosynthesis glycosyltransferase [Bacteroidota bacterium]
MDTKISVIIPVLNEAALIGTLLQHLKKEAYAPSSLELIVVDGGSSDATVQIALSEADRVIRSERGRAKQMNLGAMNANGTILYFVHADTFPPKHYDRYIREAHGKGATAGCFRMRFDTKNWFLRFFAWLSKINHTLCRGGDQTLFVTKAVFEHTGRFDEEYLIYEDSEFIRRLYKTTKFHVLPYAVITSARKYRQKGWLKVQFHFGMIHLKNYLGASPKHLFQYYKKNILT